MKKIRELKVPEEYDAKYSIRETERAIKCVKDTFEKKLAGALNLDRISAPLFVTEQSGLNDNLNGVERPVSFDILNLEEDVQIVHSLAKWKRYALKSYNFEIGTGLYTDMNAIRRDEVLDNLHSVYVDQWDWEKVIKKEDRNVEFLKDIVRKIYSAIKITEDAVCSEFTKLDKILPKEIKFITSEELLQKYPDKTGKERENAIAKEFGAVFLMQIGDKLSNGIPHDGRAPDYDDWTLNGDILVWYEPLKCAFELSSMGIRVDEISMKEQLKKADCAEREKLPFHKALLSGELPYTIGGGIGQSRLCMLLLKKAHIGEVQASIWPEEIKKICTENGIHIL